MSKLLFDSNPLVIIPELAVAIGLNESIILQQLHYWLQKSKNYYDGRAWVYNSIPEWCEQFPFLAQRTIERAMASLKSKELVITGNYNKMKADRTLWYSIDYERLEAIEEHKKSALKSHEQTFRQNGGMVASNWRDDNDKMGSPIPEITTEITTEIKNQSVSPENEKKKTDGQTEFQMNESHIKNQIGYDSLIQVHSPQFIDEIVLNILDMYFSKNIKIKGDIKPQIIVKSVLAKLNHWHIQYVIERYNEVVSPIKNKKEYIQTMIYNSVLEMDAHNLNGVRSWKEV